jgi:hypothetical protein
MQAVQLGLAFAAALALMQASAQSGKSGVEWLYILKRTIL